MALPNDKRALQDRLSRVATRMAQKFGAVGWTGGGGTGGIPVSVLQNRIAGKKVILDNTGNEDPSALSFSLVDLGSGITATTGEQLTAATYIAEQFPTGLYGSALPLVMLAKLKAGVDSVDFHVVGDSNSGHPQNGRGWQEGLARGMIRGCSAAMYGTGICPVAVHHTSSVGLAGNAGPIGNGGGYKFTNSYIFNGASSDNANTGVTVQNGNSHAPADLKQYFDIFGSQFTFANGVTADFAWLPPTGLSFTRGETTNSIHEWRDSGLENYGHIDTRNPITYRVVHSVNPGSSGSFPLWIHGLSNGTGYGNLVSGFTFFGADGGGVSDYQAAGKRISTAAGATGITASSFTIPADSTRKGVTLSFSWYGYGAGLAGATYAQGPVAVYLESMHGNTKGWAVTNILYQSGATTGKISQVLAVVGSTASPPTDSCMRTILKETRERQIQAGGSGNVLVFVNSGINDANGPEGSTLGYSESIKSIVSTYQSTWDSLNYPENDLGFVVTVTHPTQAGDSNLVGMRTSGQSLNQSKSNVLFVDITQLGPNGITFGGLTYGNSFNSSGNFYEAVGTSHLTNGNTGGYAYLAELLIKRCLRYSAVY